MHAWTCFRDPTRRWRGPRAISPTPTAVGPSPSAATFPNTSSTLNSSAITGDSSRGPSSPHRSESLQIPETPRNSLQVNGGDEPAVEGYVFLPGKLEAKLMEATRRSRDGCFENPSSRAEKCSQSARGPLQVVHPAVSNADEGRCIQKLTGASLAVDWPSRLESDSDDSTHDIATNGTCVESQREACSELDSNLDDEPDDIETDYVGGDECGLALFPELLYSNYPTEVLEELILSVFLDQLVTRHTIEPWVDLHALRVKGLPGYTRTLAERIAKHQVLYTQIGRQDTKTILGEAMKQYKLWNPPLGSMEEIRTSAFAKARSPTLPDQLLPGREYRGQARVLSESWLRQNREILSWFYLLRLLGQLQVLPDIRSFPYSPASIQEVLQGVWEKFKSTEISECERRFDWKLLMACGLRHRALLDTRQRHGQIVDAQVRYVWYNLFSRRLVSRRPWIIGETERLLFESRAPLELGDAERMERCQEILKLQPFESLEERYPEVDVLPSPHMAISDLQRLPCFSTDFLAVGYHDPPRELYFYYCCIALATLGFEPPLNLDIELGYLLALIRRAVQERADMKYFLMKGQV
ncbi:hypothetical protein FDECE_16277 [Fusarium decemcellulare]|nr:hypothetical protein FDECE_16277 [Fusarium decemcellulare]